MPANVPTHTDYITIGTITYTEQTPVQPSSGGMYLGNLGISKIFMGNSEVSKIYLGDALVYEGVSIPDNALLTADNTYLVDSTGGYLLTTEI